MPTKKQHYVPRIYLKDWETTVCNNTAPNPFSGVYTFEDKKDIGEGKKRESILWERHIYTVLFSDIFIFGEACPKILTDFANQINIILKDVKNGPVYGKYGYHIIKTSSSIRKNLATINEWDFYYPDGRLASKKNILNQIYNCKSYILEEAFDFYYERDWEVIKNEFINAVKSKLSTASFENEIYISQETAENILAFVLMMLCRHPNFDAMGIYQSIENYILKPLFFSEENTVDESEEENNENEKFVDSFMQCIWKSELYKIFYKNSGGFYNNVIKMAWNDLQMILYEVYDGAGEFITSDNPVFEHKSSVSLNNENGIIFSLSPRHLLFIAKGNDPINVVGFRYAKKKEIRYFNNVIFQNRKNTELGIIM